MRKGDPLLCSFSVEAELTSAESSSVRLLLHVQCFCSSAAVDSVTPSLALSSLPLSPWPPTSSPTLSVGLLSLLCALKLMLLHHHHQSGAYRVSCHEGRRAHCPSLSCRGTNRKGMPHSFPFSFS